MESTSSPLSESEKHEHAIDAAHFDARFGTHRHNGTRHPNLPAGGVDSDFYRRIDNLLDGRLEDDDDAIHKAAEGLAWVIDTCFDVKGSQRSHALVIAFCRFSVLAYRLRPTLFHEELGITTGVELSKRLGLCKATVSKRLVDLGDKVGLHLGSRRENARETFREKQRQIWQAGNRKPRKDSLAARKKPAAKPKSSCR